MLYSCFEYLFVFFFFKQKTAYEMRISDWSSDVCSSDLQVMESTVSDYSASGTKRRRTGSTLPAIAPSNVYPCRDGEYLIGANQDGVFARLAAAMGRPELASDERYATHRARGARQERSEEHTSELQSLMRISYAVFCLQKKKTKHTPARVALIHTD